MPRKAAVLVDLPCGRVDVAMQSGGFTLKYSITFYHVMEKHFTDFELSVRI
ncbi:hypothetical protein [Virgibacillus litoralis]|uniref:Uncharacterized protein n=1 Tax=Virgibacillus litoralis TaxID=578221 RepID=A0ABS4HF96_9BACI|nr:hypothetical protein [Virgibacillus litoralis]MBP1949097.1 hypothetical protein [Virgibacillus litoralis]